MGTDKSEQLMTLKKKIDSAKTELEQVRGQLKAHQARLNELGHESIADANAALDKMKAEIEQMDQQIKDGVFELERELGL